MAIAVIFLSAFSCIYGLVTAALQQPKHVAVIGFAIINCVDRLRPYYCVFYSHRGDITPYFCTVNCEIM